MIRYREGILGRLKAAGYNTARLRNENLIGQKTIQDIRHCAEIPYKTLNQLCQMLNCDISEVIEYIPDTESTGAAE